MTEENEQNARRAALLLMAYVPDDPEFAIKVLDYAKELVQDFVVRPADRTKRSSRLHSLRVVSDDGEDSIRS